MEVVVSKESCRISKAGIVSFAHISSWYFILRWQGWTVRISVKSETMQSISLNFACIPSSFIRFVESITLRISVFFDTFSRRRWTNSHEFKSNKWNRSVKNNSKRSLDTINNTIHEDTRKINNVEMIICLLLNWSYRFWYILLIFLLGYYNSCALNDSNIVNFKRTWNIIRYQLLPDRSVIVN